MAARRTTPQIPALPVQPVVIQQMQVEAYTIDEFCEAHRMGKAALYKLVEQGRAPKIMRFGETDVRISREAAAEWRKQMESEWVVPEDRSKAARLRVASCRTDQ